MIGQSDCVSGRQSEEWLERMLWQYGGQYCRAKSDVLFCWDYSLNPYQVCSVLCSHLFSVLCSWTAVQLNGVLFPHCSVLFSLWKREIQNLFFADYMLDLNWFPFSFINRYVLIALAQGLANPTRLHPRIQCMAECMAQRVAEPRIPIAIPRARQSRNEIQTWIIPLRVIVNTSDRTSLSPPELKP